MFYTININVNINVCQEVLIINSSAKHLYPNKFKKFAVFTGLKFIIHICINGGINEKTSIFAITQ